jgi:hypothetical protein
VDPAHRNQDPPKDDHGADVIHFSTSAEEQATKESSKDCRDQGVWRYHQRNARGRDLNYIGHATYIGGAEGERLRSELALVIRDLLDWAATHESAAASPEERSDRGAA